MQIIFKDYLIAASSQQILKRIMNISLEIPKFKALLLDDHVIFSQGLAELLRAMSPESEIAYFSSVETAKVSLQKEEYQFLLSDITIPGSDTLAFIKYCKKNFPDLVIIILSNTTDMTTIKEFYSLGISAYLSKAVNKYELKTALEKTYHGENYISADLSGRLASSLFVTEKNALTKKEIEILRTVASGYSVDAAAKLLHLSPYTILAHRRNIMKKLDLHSAGELVKYAFENNLQ